MEHRMHTTTFRELEEAEYPVLRDFTYHAIFVPDGAPQPPRSITKTPELLLYFEDFGRPGDIAVACDVDGTVAGLAWVRIMDDYGHVADDIPSLSMAVLPEFRGHGIGTYLLQTLLGEAKEQGYRGISLSVQKDNPAHHLYQRVGFEIHEERDTDYLMVTSLV